MFFFPLLNIVFLFLIYRVHRRVFWWTSLTELILCIGGVIYIESSFDRTSNLLLYYLALTGAGFIVGFAAFLLAISLNHKHLYTDIPHPKNSHE